MEFSKIGEEITSLLLGFGGGKAGASSLNDKVLAGCLKAALVFAVVLARVTVGDFRIEGGGTGSGGAGLTGSMSGLFLGLSEKPLNCPKNSLGTPIGGAAGENSSRRREWLSSARLEVFGDENTPLDFGGDFDLLEKFRI